MRFLIQRVSEANVEIDKQVIASINKGFLVFIGIRESDNKQIADRMLEKLIKLRIFEDEEGKSNLSLKDVGGSLLLVSQFTLYANCKKGNRPSFIDAGNPSFAKEMYEYIVDKSKELVDGVKSGEFAGDMKVKLVNEGPFTIMLDSAQLAYD